MTTRIEVDRSLPVSAPCRTFVAACKAWTDDDSSRLLMRWPGRFGIFTVRELLDEIADSAAYTEHFWQTHNDHKDVIEVRVDAKRGWVCLRASLTARWCVQSWPMSNYPVPDISLDLDVGLRVLESRNPDMLGLYYMASKLELPCLTFDRLDGVCSDEANVAMGIFPMGMFMIVRLPTASFKAYEPRVGCSFEQV